jgi:nitrite reductase (NADH) small subunit/3-phenylpropionate/trans-cinnamate dioxygenase ferredoxin subunit
MAEFHTIGQTADIPEGEARVVEINGKLIAVFHQQGQFYALDDVCPHMGASLAAGEVKDGIVTCSWHAWRFRLSDGTWMNSPKVKTGCYPVRVVDGEIQVQV